MLLRASSRQRGARIHGGSPAGEGHGGAVLAGVHDHRVPGRIFPLQDLQRQRILDLSLDEPLERARAEVPVVSLPGQKIPRGRRQFEAKLAVGQQRPEPDDLEVDDPGERLSSQARKRFQS